jgi:indole-3-glycerol phosphate synthase
LSSILDKIVTHKLTEIASAKSARPIESVRGMAADAQPPQDFLASLTATDYVGLIAEVKKASPSKGVIREDFDPIAIAKTYCESGAHCISVLTDEHFFQGSLDILSAIRVAVAVPLLRKDFIIDEYQVYEARAAGADAILLIAECLDPKQLLDLHEIICGLGMTSLVELYDERNIDAVLNCQPRLVGVNNRDLNTFEVDLGHSLRIKQQLPDEVVMVSESGIFTTADVRLLHASGVAAMLVGESLMRADDIGQAVKMLLAKPKPEN